MTGDPVTTVALRADHLPAAQALSHALGWPYRLEDWAFAHRLGRGFAVELDGRLAGTLLWWPYGEDYGSTGMIIVAPDAQRRGIGAALMERLLADAAGRTLILNSTAEGLKLYSRLGFQPTGRIRQHQAPLEGSPAPSSAERVRPWASDDLPTIHRLDRAASGMDRSNLVAALSEIADFQLLERNGQVCGYGCVRVWGRGVVIGPVVAPDAEGARALIAALAAGQVGKFVRIDVTDASGLSPWLESIGLPAVGDVVAMARGPAPKPSAHAQLFALSNQSLG